jgi:hypothetical protein
MGAALSSECLAARGRPVCVYRPGRSRCGRCASSNLNLLRGSANHSTVNGSAPSSAVSTPAVTPNSLLVTSSRQPHIASAKNANPAITTRLELKTMWCLSSWWNRKRCSADGAIVQTAARGATQRSRCFGRAFPTTLGPLSPTRPGAIDTAITSDLSDVPMRCAAAEERAPALLSSGRTSSAVSRA